MFPGKYTGLSAELPQACQSPISKRGDRPLNSLIGRLLMFLLLYFMARCATQTDPQILRFLLTAGRLRAKYDPVKFAPIEI